MKRTIALCCALGLAAAPAAAGGEDAAQRRLTGLSLEISREVAELRGWAFAREVKTAYFKRDQIAAKMLEDMAEDYPEERLRADEAFLKTIGVVPRDVDLKAEMLRMLTAQVAGFYDPKDKTFYVIDEVAARYGPLSLAVVIAHELTHALDDQRFDLEKLIDGAELDEDRTFAVSAFVEGSASALMNRYLVRKLEAQGSAAFGLAIFSAVSVFQDREALAEMMRAPRYLQTMLARYTAGEAFVNHGAFHATAPTPAEREAYAVARLAGDPPRSSEQILHPAKYWDADQRDDPIVPDAAHLRKLLEQAGMNATHEQTAGELLCALAAGGDPLSGPLTTGAAEDWTNDAASGWGGDRFFLIEGDEGDAEPRGVWVTIWDTPEDRDEFLGYYGEAPNAPDFEWIEWGTRGAVLLFNIDAERADAFHRLLIESPPKLTRSGEPIDLD